MIEAGDQAPRFSLPDVDGRAVSLDDTLQGGHNALLVFLRHLG
ncbi:MAG: redoxin domain-containing protein [Chloroflexi bacterium]|nr:redoxin domain-containing protein [Chloroflexota bacterium]